MLTRTAGSSGRRGLPAARLFGPATEACRTRFLLAGNLAPMAATGAADDAAEDIPNWRLLIFGDKIGRVPAFLVPELTAMAKELPGTDLDRRIYYERVHALLAVTGAARSANPAGFNLDEPALGRGARIRLRARSGIPPGMLTRRRVLRREAALRARRGHREADHPTHRLARAAMTRDIRGMIP
jgi:hypothetical protein